MSHAASPSGESFSASASVCGLRPLDQGVGTLPLLELLHAGKVFALDRREILVFGERMPERYVGEMNADQGFRVRASQVLGDGAAPVTTVRAVTLVTHAPLS